MPETVKKLFADKIEGKFEKTVMSGIPGHEKIMMKSSDEWMKIAEESLSEDDFAFAPTNILKKNLMN